MNLKPYCSIRSLPPPQLDECLGTKVSNLKPSLLVKSFSHF